jgi:hypothetical protein
MRVQNELRRKSGAKSRPSRKIDGILRVTNRAEETVMPRKPQSRSSTGTFRTRRAWPSAAELRPIQIGVPDTRIPEFATVAHAESVAVASSPTEAADQAFIDAISAPMKE